MAVPAMMMPVMSMVIVMVVMPMMAVVIAGEWVEPLVVMMMMIVMMEWIVSMLVSLNVPLVADRSIYITIIFYSLLCSISVSILLPSIYYFCLIILYYLSIHNNRFIYYISMHNLYYA